MCNRSRIDRQADTAGREEWNSGKTRDSRGEMFRCNFIAAVVELGGPGKFAVRVLFALMSFHMTEGNSKRGTGHGRKDLSNDVSLRVEATAGSIVLDGERGLKAFDETFAVTKEGAAETMGRDSVERTEVVNQ